MKKIFAMEPGPAAEAGGLRGAAGAALPQDAAEQ